MTTSSSLMRQPGTGLKSLICSMSTSDDTSDVISVDQAVGFPEAIFTVTVRQGTGETMHTVTVTQDYYEKLTGAAIEPDELVRRSFRFLLEREPKESILPDFDLQLIARYFPEYEQAVMGEGDTSTSSDS